jgi:hypothetical protein
MRVFVSQLYNNFLFITLNEECKNYKLPLSQLVSNTFQLLFLWQKRQEHHKHSVTAETIIYSRCYEKMDVITFIPMRLVGSSSSFDSTKSIYAMLPLLHRGQVKNQLCWTI